MHQGNTVRCGPAAAMTLTWPRRSAAKRPWPKIERAVPCIRLPSVEQGTRRREDPLALRRHQREARRGGGSESAAGSAIAAMTSGSASSSAMRASRSSMPVFEADAPRC
jgi:hypothetical protein